MSLFVVTSTVLKGTGRVFCGLSLNSDFSGFWVMGFLFFEDCRDELSFTFLCIKDTCCQHDLSLLKLTLIICLMGLSGLTVIKFLFFLLSVLYFLEVYIHSLVHHFQISVKSLWLYRVFQSRSIINLLVIVENTLEKTITRVFILMNKYSQKDTASQREDCALAS